MGDFGGLSCTNSSRKPEYSPILTPSGRSDRCQRHRGLNGQPTAEADTFGLGMWHWVPPALPVTRKFCAGPHGWAMSIFRYWVRAVSHKFAACVGSECHRLPASWVSKAGRPQWMIERQTE